MLMGFVCSCVERGTSPPSDIPGVWGLCCELYRMNWFLFCDISRVALQLTASCIHRWQMKRFNRLLATQAIWKRQRRCHRCIGYHSSFQQQCSIKGFAITLNNGLTLSYSSLLCLEILRGMDPYSLFWGVIPLGPDSTLLDFCVEMKPVWQKIIAA